MKTLLLKQALSFGMFAVAATGALLTHSEKTENRSLPVQQGYVKGNPLATVCNNPKDCRTEDGTVCRVLDHDVSSAQLFGLEGDKCTRTLYRITP